MGFFTSDFKLAEETADPKVSQSYQPTAAVSPLSASRAVTGDPLSQFAQQLSGGGGGTSGYGWGAGTDASLTGTGALSNSMISGFTSGTGGFGFPEPSTNPITERGVDTLTGYTSSEGDSSVTGMEGSGTSAQAPTLADYQNYLEYRDYYQFGLGMLGGMTGIPGASSGLGVAADLNYGINPTGIGTMFMDKYTVQGGPGSSGEYTGGVMSPSEQRDQLITQAAFDELPDSTKLFGGFFDWSGTNVPAYDPDLDLSIGPWQDMIMTYPKEPVPPTQEYVIEDPKDMQIDNIAGGYTWDSGLGTTEEMQEETGLGTSEWDTSHSDFSWGDSSDAGDGTTDASDDPGGDDDDAGGWSFSDDDSGGGDSGGGDSGGGGGSYIATAATQALGEEGLTIFENWRDYMFDALPTFTTSYGRYRVTAPKIVAEIDKKDNSKEIYSWIWDMHLKPIFDMITEDRDSTKALKDYKIMVRELQNKFLSKERV